MTSAFVTSWVRALVAPGGSLARRNSSHCPRHSLRLITVANRCSSGTSGSSSHACGTSPVQTVSGGTLVGGCAELHRALRELPVVPEFEVGGLRFFAPLRECLPFDLQLQVAMLARYGQSALYLSPEPYKLLRLPSKLGPEHPLYFRAVWPFGVHGGTFRWREEGAHLGLSFRLWIRRWQRWGRFWFRFWPFGQSGRGARSPCTGPRLGPGLFWCRFGGRLRCVAVLKSAVCRSLPFSLSVHTPKLVHVFL